MLKGAYTLLITPFKQDLSLDEDGLRVLVRRQVQAGVHGIAPLGVTGENSLMSEKEIARLVEIVVDEVSGKCPVIPDTCTSGIDATLERIRLFEKIGCKYVSVFVPYLALPKCLRIEIKGQWSPHTHRYKKHPDLLNAQVSRPLNPPHCPSEILQQEPTPLKCLSHP